MDIFGKLEYTIIHGESLWKANFIYSDGNPAAVGPNNQPLLSGFNINAQGQILDYNGHAKQDLELARNQMPFETDQMRVSFRAMQQNWQDAQAQLQNLREKQYRFQNFREDVHKFKDELYYERFVAENGG